MVSPRLALLHEPLAVEPLVALVEADARHRGEGCGAVATLSASSEPRISGVERLEYGRKALALRTFDQIAGSRRALACRRAGHPSSRRRAAIGGPASSSRPLPVIAEALGVPVASSAKRARPCGSTGASTPATRSRGRPGRSDDAGAPDRAGASMRVKVLFFARLREAGDGRSGRARSPTARAYVTSGPRRRRRIRRSRRSRAPCPVRSTRILRPAAPPCATATRSPSCRRSPGGRHSSHDPTGPRQTEIRRRPLPGADAARERFGGASGFDEVPDVLEGDLRAAGSRRSVRRLSAARH